MKLLIAIFSLALCQAAFAGDVEDSALSELVRNQDKPAKNSCELQPGRTVPVKAFLHSYLNWSLKQPTGDSRKSFKCTRQAQPAGSYDCIFRYGEPAKENEHPGWDMSLEFAFKYVTSGTVKKGEIDWRTIQCVSTP